MRLLIGHIFAFTLIYIGYQAVFWFLLLLFCCFEKADMNTLVTTVLLTALKMSYRLRLIVKLSIKERPCIICYHFFSSRVRVG